MKSPLYWVAQTSSDLQLNRDLPRCKTILEGWDSQSWFWQANKAGDDRAFRRDDEGSPTGVRCGEEGYPRRTAQPSSAAAEPDEQAQQGPSACSLEGKSISQVHQMLSDLICAEKERARDAAEKVG